jgi:hypothetical protein
MQTDWTEVGGLLGFVPAALTAMLASSRAPRRPGGGRFLWAALATVHTLLTVEVLTWTRFIISDELRHWLTKAGHYSDRREPQAWALFIVFVAAAAASAWLVRRAPTRNTAVASGATAAVLTVFIVETVSLHTVDALLYTYVGPMFLVGWLWLACGWITAAAALHSTSSDEPS